MNPSSESSEQKWWRATWLKWAAVIAFFVGGFYGVSDLLGAMAWLQAQKEIAAAGESLDPKKFIPPEAPEEQNFGALPIFKLEPEASGYYPYSISYPYLAPKPLRRALSRVDPIPTSKTDGKLPYLGQWRKGEKPEMAEVRKELDGLCTEPHSPQATALELFALLCPALADLRANEVSHPECRFEADYLSPPQGLRSLGGIVSQLQLAHILAYEERLALLNQQPVLAFRDLQVGWKIDSGVRKDASVEAGFVSVGVVAIQSEAVREGMDEHKWTEDQLRAIDFDLGKIDYLKQAQYCLRVDTAIQRIPDTDYFKYHREEFEEILFTLLSTQGFQKLIRLTIFEVIPDGWFDQFKADYSRYNLLGIVPMIDPVAHRVYPERMAKAQGLIDDSRASSLWRNFMTMRVATTSNIPERFAYAQVQLDEARLACRLERYRLTHGVYPETLAAMEPLYGPNPHDVMDGQPYRYRRESGGTYTLYSIGWNQKDDGGDGSTPSYYGWATQASPDWLWISRPDPSKFK